MKKLAAALLIVSTCVATSAFAQQRRAAAPAPAAAEPQFAVGVAYGLDYSGTLSIRGDMDISRLTNGQPLKARIGYDRASQTYNWFGGSYTWTHSHFYGSAYYDFNKLLKLDRRLHPFAGAGYGFGSVSCSGSWCGGGWSSPSVGGVYVLGGIQYNVTNAIDVEASYNNFAGVSIGANFRF